MEGRKQSDSSSFAADLFGSKDSPPSPSTSTGIFGSIFATSPKVLGRESVRYEMVEKKQYPPPFTPSWNVKTDPDTADNNISQASPGENQSAAVRDMNSYYYQEEKMQPCHLSSSIYYGGQDVYSRPKSTQSTVHTTFSKESGDDDSGCASRGNWWQGSLYY